MKLIFAGTPDIAATVLQDLLSSKHDIVAVYTQPDRPAGRGRKLTPSPVKTLALEHDIPVEQPVNFKEETALQTLKNYQADIMVVIAYGLILPKRVLDTPKNGCLNIHVSLLPKWRGAAPIQHAILSGDSKTGVTIMKMDEGLDTGDIYQQTSCNIHETDTSGMLHDRLAKMAIKPLSETLEQISQGTAKAQKQDHTLATYAHKIAKTDARIDWQKSAADIDRMIRAYHPWPIAFIALGDTTLRVWRAHVIESSSTKKPGTILSSDKQGIVVQTGNNAIALTELQLPGKKAMPAAQILQAQSELFAAGKLL